MKRCEPPVDARQSTLTRPHTSQRQEPTTKLVTQGCGLCRGDRGNAERASVMAALVIVITIVAVQAREPSSRERERTPL